MAETTWRDRLYDKAADFELLELEANLWGNCFRLLKYYDPDVIARSVLFFCRITFADTSFEDLDLSTNASGQIEKTLDTIPEHWNRMRKFIKEVLLLLCQLKVHFNIKIRLLTLFAIRTLVPYEKDRIVQIMDEEIFKKLNPEDKFYLQDLANTIQNEAGIPNGELRKGLVETSKQIRTDLTSTKINFKKLFSQIMHQPQEESLKNVEKIFTNGSGDQLLVIINLVYTQNRTALDRIKLVLFGAIGTNHRVSVIRARQHSLLLLNAIDRHDSLVFGSEKYFNCLAYGFAKLMTALKTNPKLDPKEIKDWDILSLE